MKKVLYFIAVVLITTGCATGYYAPHNVNQFGAQTHVVLDKPNFRIVKNIEVVIDVNNTNLKRADVEKSAYAELLRRANLTGTQALINVVIEEVRRESTNFFRALFGLPKVAQHVAARATIIEFVDGTVPSTAPVTYKGSAPRTQVENSNVIVTEPTTTTYQGSAPREQAENTNQQEEAETIEILTSEKKALSDNDIVNIPDAAFLKAILKKVDTNKDGKISKLEAMQVTKLNLYAKGIKNMNGIEQFENLRYLNVERNEFTVIDLSYNTKLEQVYAYSEFVKTVYLSKGSKTLIDINKRYIIYK